MLLGEWHFCILHLFQIIVDLIFEDWLNPSHVSKTNSRLLILLGTEFVLPAFPLSVLMFEVAFIE